MSSRLARFLLRIFGWRIEGGVPASLHKYVIIAAPHTSWSDFFLGLATRAAMGRKIYFLGKQSLFKGPLGWTMRALGGYPVDRSKATGLVDQVIAMFQDKEAFAIALAPEGTRKKVTEFRSGFYYIAAGAGVPIICVQLNYGTKRVVFREPFYPTENASEDLRILWNYFVGVKGKRAELGITEKKRA
jgi:1-acyl-sn-glycerol-3-phosphate acyltransferase